MILILAGVVATLVFTACMQTGHPVLGWHLGGAIALLGGAVAGYFERKDQE